MSQASTAFALLSSMTRGEAQDAVRCVLARGKLASFAKQAWHVHHPTTELVWNWHIDCICDHLMAVTSGEIRNLAISVPPGFAKSLLVSVYWPAWSWVDKPETQFLCASAASDVALRDARRHRAICSSGWYQRTFLPRWTWDAKQDAKGNFSNSENGFRISRSVGMAITGFRGDILILDDPLDASQAFSDKAKLEDTLRWRDTVFSTRKNAPDSREVVIMQRLHESDMIGHLLQKSPDTWVHLTLPNEYDPKRTFHSPIGWSDPRKEPGKLLFPDFLDKKRTKEVKSDLGSAAYSAQYNQDPVPEVGNVFRRSWFLRWNTADQHPWEAKVAACDFNRLEKARHTKDTDYAVIDVWGIFQRNYHLLYQHRAKMGLAESIYAVEQLVKHHPGICRILIEKAANGPSVIKQVQHKIACVEGISVQGESKVQRATAVTPVAQDGRILIPEPWGEAEAWLSEVCGFPGRRRDDRVDTLTMAIIWAEENLMQNKIWSFGIGGSKKDGN